jgi:phosphohistidine phosphatase
MTKPAPREGDTGGRELLILRHAKSAWDTDAATDRDRPLASRGERDAPRMGAWIKERGLVPELVLCSPAVRAAQTVELVMGAFEGDTPTVRHEERLYASDLASLVAVIGETPSEIRRLMIVGHNPTLEVFVQILAESWEPADGGKFFPTCALAWLRLDGEWSDLQDGTGTLLELVRPRELSR